MGAWGTAVLSDDTVADIVAFITDRLKAGESLDSAVAKTKAKFAELERDSNEGPLLWMAIAHCQWKWGLVDADVLARVRNDIAAGRGLDRWVEDDKALSKRQVMLQKFLRQIESPNPKQSAIPKIVVREAPFRKGDCLSVLLPDGRYTAALVLAEDNSRPEQGMNLVASLDYCDAEPPTLDVFKRREWLVLFQGIWKGKRDISWFLPVRLKSERKRITVVGNVRSKWLDPKGSSTYKGWQNIGDQILLVRAHRGQSL